MCGRRQRPRPGYSFWGELPQCEVGVPVRGDQQDPVLQRQVRRPALADRVRASLSQVGDQPCRGLSWVKGAIKDDSDAVITDTRRSSQLRRQDDSVDPVRLACRTGREDRTGSFPRLWGQQQSGRLLSYSGFAAFRRHPAQTEAFDLSEM